MEEDSVSSEISIRAEAWLESAKRSLRVADASSKAIPLILVAGRRAIALAQEYPDGVPANEVAAWEAEVFPFLSRTILTCLDYPLKVSHQFPEEGICDLSSRTVIIGNHPSTGSIFTFYDQLRSFGPFRFVVKDTLDPNHAHSFKERIEAILVGGPLAALDKAIFVNRNPGQGGRFEIETALEKQFHLGSSVVIFPDAHRFTRERRDADRQRFCDKCKDLKWMNDTCFPRSGGLWTILNGLRNSNEPIRVIDATIVEPEFLGQAGPGLFMKFANVTDRVKECSDEHHLQGLLVELWKDKNSAIADRRK